MSTPTADQFLMGGGVKSAKFANIGDGISGTISEYPEVRQQTDLKTGKLKTWDDGRPKMQLVVTLQTTLRDDAEDDGLRRIYVKGKSLTDVVRDAVRKAGAQGLEVGGQLRVQYVGDGEAANRSLDPPKLYAAEYARPQQQAAQQFLNGQPQQGFQQAPQQQGFQQPQQAPPQQGFQQPSGFGTQPQARPPF